MGILLEPIRRLARGLIAGESGRYVDLDKAEIALIASTLPGGDALLQAIDESVRRQSDGVYGVTEAEQHRFPVQAYAAARYLQIFEIEEPQNNRLFILKGSESIFCPEAVRPAMEES